MRCTSFFEDQKSKGRSQRNTCNYGGWLLFIVGCGIIAAGLLN